jgi:3-isopropylmalate/(R)-2-methylmalate dehydratase small subunit
MSPSEIDGGSDGAAARGSRADERSRVWKFGQDIDTDALAPGAYMKLAVDGIAAHCLESIRPEFAANVRRGDVVVAGPNFGIGSSREQAAAVLLHLGIRAVIAPSYGGLFFRNAFNLGLLLLTSAHADALDDGDFVLLRTEPLALEMPGGALLPLEPVPDFLIDMAQAGGLLNQLRRRLGRREAC